jgi:hypothetical protein
MQYPLTDKKDFGYNSQKPAHISQTSYLRDYAGNSPTKL